MNGVSRLKIGLLPELHVETLVEWIVAARARRATAGEALRVVCDPVLSATEGGTMGASASAALQLARHSDLMTPNVDELRILATLAGLREPDEDSRSAARRCIGDATVADTVALTMVLSRRYGGAWLVK